MCVELPCGYSSQTLTKIIAYCHIVIHVCLIAIAAFFGLVSESLLDSLNDANDKLDINTNHSRETELGSVIEENTFGQRHDLVQFMELPYAVRTCFVIWIVLNFITGLIFSIILLQGAQERKLLKVKIWFFVTIVTYLLWIPIYAYWVCNAAEPVNVFMSGFTTYMLEGLCLWVVSGFIEELRIESISHRVGYKDVHIPFFKI